MNGEIHPVAYLVLRDLYPAGGWKTQVLEYRDSWPPNQKRK